MNKVLIAGAKKTQVNTLGKSLNPSETKVCVTLFSSLAASLAEESPQAVLVVMENIDVLEEKKIIDQIHHFDDNLPIIVLSASREIDSVVQMMKTGIYDYFTLPADSGKLQKSVQNACRLYDLTKRVYLLENRLGNLSKLEGMVGESPAMQALFRTIQNVSATNATVLITGESGTGKELVAKALHHLSPRDSRRFIDINCGAIPRELLENELFGHERGAYTGADRRYVGCCERADGGTLFLDEISEMEPGLQVKLLRFLQERQFMRVGGNELIKVDVRVVAATNRDLADAILKGGFREDLFYRLNVVTIHLPPLRERREDIPLLARHFLEKYSRKNEKIFLDFAPDAMEALIRHDWPGNIRELENTIERAVVLHNDSKIKLAYLPEPLRQEKGDVPFPFPLFAEKMDIEKVLPLTIVERYAIESALKACTGNVAIAAKRLKIGQATLYRKIKLYGIRV